MSATLNGESLCRHERVEVFVGERERTPWRSGRVLMVGPLGQGPMGIPSLPDGTVRILTDPDPVDGFPGFTITHDTTDPELTGLLRRLPDPS